MGSSSKTSSDARYSEIIAAEKASSDAKIASNLKEQKDKEAAIEGMKEMGNQLILIAGEEEELQELKRIGIQY